MAQKEFSTGSILEIPDMQKRKEALAKQYNQLRERARQKVKGKFIYHEVPGGVFEFSYGPMYKGDSPERYTFIDGGIYEIPYGVAVHLNKNVWYPQYGFIAGEPDVMGAYESRSGTAMKVTHKVRRVSFQALEFLDLENIPSSDIVHVEKVV